MKKTAKKPKKQGRPPLPAGQVRDKWLNDVRFSADELARLKALAEKTGQTWTEWVRQRLGI